MEILLSPDQEARLAELAARDGRKTSDLVREAVQRFLDEEARFAEAVKRGQAAADNGDLVPPEEVWARVEPASQGRRLNSDELLARVHAIQAQVAKLPVLDTRSPDEILDYNELGHFY